MLVSLEFDIDGKSYRVERGRKPNILKFYVDNEQTTADDEAQGDSRETQDAIERLLGLSHDMFRHVVALNTYTEPFLSLKANDQRMLIEQLLGITLLSERAERIKERGKQTKDAIQQEEFRIRAVQEANKRIEEQIDAARRRQTLWQKKRDEDIATFQAAYDELSKVDIEAELQAHQALTEYNVKKKVIADLTAWIKRCELDDAREKKDIEKLKLEIASLEHHTCHSCGQAFHDSKHEQVLETKRKALSEAAMQALSTNGQWMEHTDALRELGALGTQPSVFYDQESDAYEHRSSMAHVLSQLMSKQNEIDPYVDQISDMTAQAVQSVEYDALNELTRLQDHQEFLLKLLTQKDSFIRKKIIEQNLSYLNARLTHYLDRIGLPHTVVFQNDLTVQIEELGRELDFDNLSRGERNRLILSMSWAFRDVWESLYRPINLLFIDEMIDSGMDTQGVENSLALLKKMSRERSKSIWLVSHRDELAGRVENILRVVKENGFTSYNTDIETV